MSAEEGVAVILPEYLVDAEPRETCEGPSRNASYGTSSQRLRQYCSYLIRGETCHSSRCDSFHDLDEFVAHYAPPETGLPCPFLEEYGVCPYSVNCLFGTHFRTSLADLRAKKYPPLRDQLVKYQNAFTTDVAAELRRSTFRQNPVPTRQRANLRELLSTKGCAVLAPMCTIGSLPFRRLCVEYGCPVTLSEMVFARDILQGNKAELTKIRRHPSERCFGIQLTGRGQELIDAALFIAQRCDCDFIDLNAACPQELATKRCCGAAIGSNRKRLQSAVNCLLQVGLRHGIPITVKLRAGDLWGNWQGIASALLLRETRITAISMHARSAKQRYSKLADWNYLMRTKRALETGIDPDDPNDKPEGIVALDPDSIPLLGGNGDIFHWNDLEDPQHAAVDYVLIGRGAAIKPWIFQELREHKTLDPSSKERLEMLRRFANYCLEYYGTDAIGTERARAQFLENWSFMCRYIPVGIMGAPQRINQRPPSFRGRDDLETLMSSTKAHAWVTLSEQLFGPVPTGFTFVPKHKSSECAS
ncbi:putative Dihydrouridine synthase [Giardia muris]|uniref:tRNA-dihydrouridine(47) synthase [NAD(P)(+)] n=1 Tax=Giardia muris TaxID=5742 RepID=A0A4Z1SSF4_GIAMU|nr:putative Dihydrouridine synthase [Giardia muris]|eukprot:TNJ28872.1 putative Dihydrouridine synthase [Giardia muris]